MPFCDYYWHYLDREKYMDNDYIVKLNTAAFGLLHDLMEEEVARAREAGMVSLELGELWLALKRLSFTMRTTIAWMRGSR